MEKTTDTLRALSLRALNPGAWSGIRGWSEQQSGPLIESINPATGQRLAQVRGAPTGRLRNEETVHGNER